MDEPDRAVTCGAGADVRLGDGVVAAEHDRDQAGVEHLADGRLDRSMRTDRIGGEHGRIAVVDDAKLGEGVDLRLEVRTGRAARRSDRAWPVAGAGPVGDEVVRRCPDDRDVEAGEQRRVLRAGRAAVRQRPCIVRLLAVFAPALERIDHAGDAKTRGSLSSPTACPP
jgi:hypothetical protein